MFRVCFTAQNIGAGASAPFKVSALASGSATTFQRDVPSLNAGATHITCMPYSGALPAGEHKVAVRVDAAGAVAESDEGNNDHTITVTVQR
jgi:subtilase family serine protease